MPDKESQLEYLHRVIRFRLTRLDSSVAWYRKRHYISQMSTVVLSAVITVVAGFKWDWVEEPQTRNIVLVVGALVTIISAWGAFFSPKDFWHLNNETYSKLRALQSKLEFLERAEDFSEREADSVKELYAEYQGMLDGHDKKWRELRQKPL